MFPSDGFHRMGLVENHSGVVGENADPQATEREVADKKRVVDDQDLSGLDVPPRVVIKAVGMLGAIPPHAIAAVAGDFVPHIRRWPNRKFAERAFAGLASPIADLVQLVELLRFSEQIL